MKTVRPVAIADHLWETLDRMAVEMGTDRESLVNQALHQFARLNGYLVPGTVAPEAPGPSPEPPTAERLAVAEQVLETAARLERAIQERPPPVPRRAAAEAARQPERAADAAPATLVLVRDDGSEIEVAKDRFVVGRGRHCDLVVDSGKVSREHAAILREDGAWWIEDLGSANGTWHDRARVQRRRIHDGDEYFVCSERIRCRLR